MEKRPKIWYDYQKYLLRSIGFSKKGYKNLLKHLHDIPYEFDESVPFDENRGEDGILQRYYFFKSIGLTGGEFEYPCSVLEMLIAFAVRFGTDWLGYDDEDMKDHYERIFILFIHNLGLDKFDDKYCEIYNYIFYEEIDEIVGNWLHRNYKDDGVGSIFPLSKKVKGFRELEMYKQIFEYLNQTNIQSTKDLRYLD